MANVSGARASALAMGILLVVALAGCSAPIGVQRASPQVVQRALTENVLTTGELSVATRNTLHAAGLLDVYREDPAAAIAAGHDSLVLYTEHRPEIHANVVRGLSALAEASFRYAEQSGDRSYFILAALYAWMYLFDDPGKSEIDILDPGLRLAANLYNRGIARAVLPRGEEEDIVLRSGTLKLPFAELEVELDPEELRWGSRRFSHFTSATDLAIKGLNNRYHAPGLGAALAGAAVPTDRDSDEGDLLSEHVQVPLSMLLVFDDPVGRLSSGELRGHIELHAASAGRTTEINGRKVALELDSTAALALTLTEEAPWRREIRGFFEGDLALEYEGLVSLSFHEKGRIPVVLVHGTASSTATWANFLNDLTADPLIRRGYEFFLFTYNTGAPIPYSAWRLRKAIADMVQTVDPEGRDPALRKAVVIGHSQGGLLTKMLAIDSGDVFWSRAFDVPPSELDVSDETRELMEGALLIEPSPYVSRVVFIATPHRGSYLLNFGPARLLGGFVRTPANVVRAVGDVLVENPEVTAIRRIDDVEGALGQMNPSSPFLEGLIEMPIAPGIRAHSIIGVREYVDKEEATDGVVKYTSAHLEGVDSEVVVQTGHSSLANPYVIWEARRILRMHLLPTRSDD
jgi:pimeloyl-ACP methyl ester carboxylesterase